MLQDLSKIKAVQAHFDDAARDASPEMAEFLRHWSKVLAELPEKIETDNLTEEFSGEWKQWTTSLSLQLIAAASEEDDVQELLETLGVADDPEIRETCSQSESHGLRAYVFSNDLRREFILAGTELFQLSANLHARKEEDDAD